MHRHALLWIVATHQHADVFTIIFCILVPLFCHVSSSNSSTSASHVIATLEGEQCWPCLGLGPPALGLPHLDWVLVWSSASWVWVISGWVWIDQVRVWVSSCHVSPSMPSNLNLIWRPSMHHVCAITVCTVIPKTPPTCVVRPCSGTCCAMLHLLDLCSQLKFAIPLSFLGWVQWYPWICKIPTFYSWVLDNWIKNSLIFNTFLFHNFWGK